jgi:zinc/manganese transport system permease protein
VLGAALGAAALFLYLGSLGGSTTGASFTILFGSMFAISPDTVPALITSGLLTLATVAVLSRVLLLTSLSPELAAARGVPVRAVGMAYLAALAVAVSLSAVVIGAVLSTALLIGPAATALRIASRPGRAMAAAAAIGTAAIWLGVVLSYDSYTWPPHGRGWPVSFFVVALIVTGYLLSYVRRRPAAREKEAAACSPA